MSDRARTLARIAATATVAVLAWLFVWPAVLGGSMTYIVVSGPSMEPVYETGDFVAARVQDSYDVGDIVVFATQDGNVIHRIVGGDGDAGYVMRGDNNSEIDRWTPADEDVLGKAVLHAPGVGSTVMLVRQVLITPPFPYLLAGFVFLVVVLGDDRKKAPSRPRPDSREPDEGSAPQSSRSEDSLP